MRKYEQQALGGTLILVGLWLWWTRDWSDPPDLESYERPYKDDWAFKNPVGPSESGGDYPPPGDKGPSDWMLKFGKARAKDSEWMINFNKDVAKDKRKTKRLRREESAQDKAWWETVYSWRNPHYVRKHRNVENAMHARMWDKRADEANQARFMGHTRNPLPEEIHGMEKEEQLQMIDNELVHLRAVQAQTKDAIDLWVKGGSDTTIQLMSPQTQQWAWPNQVEFENLEILEEISRLEQLKRYIIDLPF